MIVFNIEGMIVDARAKSMWKIEYLRDFLQTNKGFVPIIAITETWLKSYVKDAQLKIIPPIGVIGNLEYVVAVLHIYITVYVLGRLKSLTTNFVKLP